MFNFQVFQDGELFGWPAVHSILEGECVSYVVIFYPSGHVSSLVSVKGETI